MSRSVQKVIGKGLTKRMECGVGMGKRKPQSQLSSLEDQAESPKFWPDDMGGHQGFQAGCGTGICMLLEELSLWPESGRMPS